jgi:quinol monooxygenase YgiN
MAALELHRTTAHIKEFRAKAGDLLAEPLQVELFEMVSQKAAKY